MSDHEREEFLHLIARLDRDELAWRADEAIGYARIVIRQLPHALRVSTVGIDRASEAIKKYQEMLTLARD